MHRPSKGLMNRTAPEQKKNHNWFRITNVADSDEATVYIYDEIGYSWFGEGVTAADFVKEIAALDVSNLKVHVNSPGGDVFDGITIYNGLKQHKAEVTVYIDGLAASAASFIAQAGDKVIMARNATIMIHDAWGFCMGNESDMLETANLLSKISNNIADIYAQRAGGTIEEWRALMREEIWYSSAEAFDAKLVDEVTDADEKEEDVSNRWDLSFFNYAGRGNAPAPAEIRKRVLSNRVKEAPTMGVKNNESPEQGTPDTTGPATEQPVGPSETSPDVAPEETTEEENEEQHLDSPAIPAPEQTTPENSAAGVVINGARTTDWNAIQSHISGLETFRNETLDAGRKSFVTNLAQQGKVAASQIDSLTAFALDLTPAQYETWVASWEAAPQLSMFGNHNNNQGGGTEATNSLTAEIDRLEGIVRQHRLANMSQAQIEQTESYKRLQQLKSNNQS